MKWNVLLFIIIMLFIPQDLLSTPIPPAIKSTVGFIYILNNKGEKIANGTGFFIGVELEDKKGFFDVNLVTAKHVLQTKDKTWYPSFFLRLNKKDGSSEYLRVPIIVDGENKTVFLHPDKSIDIAVVPMLPKEDIFDFKFLPESMLITSEDFNKLNIREGSEVFFTGLFVPYQGYDKIYPIVRFGRVALITEEKIEWDKLLLDLYLIESGSFGGNSGSPVFFYLGADRNPGSIVVGPPAIKIAGVMKGAFQDIRPVAIAETSKMPVSQSNMGIAAVIPAYKLHEILFGDELKKRRATRTARH